MSLTAEEKRRLLKERREAKMANGKASDRLNKILKQGSSVESDGVTSVLDKPSGEASAEQDPDTLDIDQLLSNRVSPGPQEMSNSNPDIDQMLNQVFKQQGANGTNTNTNEQQDPISSMMMEMMKQQQQQSGEPKENLQNMEYEQKVLKHNAYKQKQLKSMFIFIRYVTGIINFGYHYINYPEFQSSTHDFIRNDLLSFNNHNFLVIFFSLEAVILSSYYIISSRRLIASKVSNDNLILKVVSMASMVVPQVSNYQPYFIALVNYWEILSMMLGDLALMVVLFGVTSCM